MAGVGEPVAAALAGDRILRVAANQESGCSQAMRAETLLGHVDQGIALGIVEEPLPRLLSGAEEQPALVEDAPSRVTGPRVLAIHLSDRTFAAIHGDI